MCASAAWAAAAGHPDGWAQRGPRAPPSRNINASYDVKIARSDVLVPVGSGWGARPHCGAAALLMRAFHRCAGQASQLFNTHSHSTGKNLAIIEAPCFATMLPLLQQ